MAQQLSGSTSKTGPVRVRFAPSPTGNLHLGGARTALFNYLFARHHKGSFILRIEDTDEERSRPEFVREIIDSLQWLGITHDEDPYFQSGRGEIYIKAAEKLIAAGSAYRCFCTQEELEARRKEAAARGENFRYDGRCARLSEDEARQKTSRGIAPALRIKIPEGTSSWVDMIRGEISIDNYQLDDFIIFKSSGVPTYHFAVVVDDIDMSITHIIRGEDHISNTPKQLVLYQALGAEAPAMAHIPLIHGADGKRLSKRHGATAVSEYRKIGFLPEVMFNFLALLGWSPGDDREVLSVDEIVELFDLKRVVKTAAIFDPEKLTWMNGLYLSKMPVDMRTDLLIPYWVVAGFLKPGEETARRQWLEEVVMAVGERIKVLSDIVTQTGFFFREDVVPDEKAAKVLRKASDLKASFIRIYEGMEALDDFGRESVENVIREVMEKEDLSARRVMQPIRAAVTGSTASPGLFECVELLGKERTLRRLKEHLGI